MLQHPLDRQQNWMCNSNIRNIQQLEDYQLMHSSSTFRNLELNSVNKSVLKLINHKMYPLNYQKTSKMFKHQRKDKFSHCHSEPNEPVWSGNSNNKEGLEWERTMGEHFNEAETRDLLFQGYKDEDYDAINDKINKFVWAKRKEIIHLETAKDKKQIQSIKSIQQSKSHLRKQSSNIQQSLAHLRKRLKEQHRRQTQMLQTQIEGLGLNGEGPKISSPDFNFFQENEGIKRVMNRYPIRQNIKIKMKQDVNKEVQKGILQQIKDSKLTDKYARMRIYINHRKMVSLR